MFSTYQARIALTLGIGSLVGGIGAATSLTGGWNTAANLETLPGSSPNINTPAVDGCTSLSADKLTIAFTSNRTGNFDIYIATRPNTGVGFGDPVPLPAGINTAADDSCPTLAQGGRMYFSSNRDDPAYDLYVTRRVGNSWAPPVHLGRNINTPGVEEESAALYLIRGHEFLLFSSHNLDDSQGKIYQSIDGGSKILVQGGPNAGGSNNRPSITPDGLTIYFDSDRPGTLGGPDLYYATRRVPIGPFGPAVHLQDLSSPGFDARPFISADAKMLTFSSGRPGSTSPAPDMWFSTR